MVVATDADPEPGLTEGFDFPALGGAVMLSTDSARRGFTRFRSATFPEYAHLFSSAIDWRVEDGRGRNVLTVEIAEDYPARVLECAEATTREVAAGRRARPGRGRRALRHGVDAGLRPSPGGAARHSSGSGRRPCRTVWIEPTPRASLRRWSP